MIHGFKGNKTITAEEWLVDYSLRSDKHIDVNHDLLNTPIQFDGKEVDAFILDAIDNKLVIQLAIPIMTTFDGKSNVYKTSYIRKLLNSQDFLSRFNQEFVKHIQLTEVHTEDYVTNDKLWLLSHEELGEDVDFLKKNTNCQRFDLFEHVDLQSYSDALLKFNNQCYGWWLRSAYSGTSYSNYSCYVGCVNNVNKYGGYVNFTNAYYTSYGALLPACAIY